MTTESDVFDETFEQARKRAKRDIEAAKARQSEATEGADQSEGQSEPEDSGKAVAKDKPPRRSKRAKATSSGRLTDKQIKDKLDEVWVGLGGALMMFDPFCGVTLTVNGPQVSDAVVEIAKVNPRVRQALEGFAQVSTWGAMLGAAGAVVMPILAHHTNLIPGGVGVMLAPTDELRAAIGDEQAERLLQAMVNHQHVEEADEYSDAGLG